MMINMMYMSALDTDYFQKTIIQPLDACKQQLDTATLKVWGLVRLIIYDIILLKVLLRILL